MSDFVVHLNLFIGKRSIEMLHEENQPAEIQEQAKELRRNPDLNVGALGERLQFYRENSTE